MLIGAAGQAVVQFAKRRQDNTQFAVKFFIDKSAFYAETALYAAYFPALKKQLQHTPADVPELQVPDSNDKEKGGRIAGSRFLPHVEAVCDSAEAGLVDPRGHALPPCIVMERGESLQDWVARAEPDRFAAFWV